MNKKKIAVLFGGHSTEYEVSLKSAASVFEHIDRTRFDVFPIGITMTGDWYHYTGDPARIPEGTWCEDARSFKSCGLFPEPLRRWLSGTDGWKIHSSED